MARREPARGSWFAALLGLSVLAAVAFVVGALAGLLWKEPGLLVAYLRGDTAEVAWTLASAEEPVPVGEVEAPPEDLAAAEATPSPETTPAEPAPEPERAAARPAPEPTPARKAAAPAAVAAAPPARIAVQVGAFSERASADRLRARLREAGFPAYLAADSRDDDHWRVRVGPYASRPEAEKVAGRLERGQQLPTWILDEDAE